MINPAGMVIKRLIPTLASNGFVHVDSADYREEFVRNAVTILYTCGKYAEDFMCEIVDANRFRFQMMSFIEVVDPTCAERVHATAAENPVDIIDSVEENFAEIARRYFESEHNLLKCFLESWPNDWIAIDEDVVARMRDKENEWFASVGLPRPDPS